MQLSRKVGAKYQPTSLSLVKLVSTWNKSLTPIPHHSTLCQSKCIGKQARMGKAGKSQEKKSGGLMHYSSYFEVLATDVNHNSASVVLVFDTEEYLFNACEGLQRYMMESKRKLAKINSYLITRISTDSLAGLPGLILTSHRADDTAVALCKQPDISVVGPRGLGLYVDAFQQYIRDEIKAKVTCTEIKGISETVIKSQYVTIKSLVIDAGVMGSKSEACASENATELSPEQPQSDSFAQEPTAKKQRLENKESPEPSGNAPHSTPEFQSGDSRPAASVAAYLAILAPSCGTFDPKKAQALGIPKGPMYGELQRGLPVTLADGRTIQPHEVGEPPAPGAFLLMLDIPSAEQLESLCQPAVTQSLLELISTAEADHSNQPSSSVARLQIMCHLGPASLVSSPAYQEWTAAVGGGWEHLLINAGVGEDNVAFRHAALLQAKLSTINPAVFPPYVGSQDPLPTLPSTSFLVAPTRFQYTMAPMKRRGPGRGTIEIEDLTKSLSEWNPSQELMTAIKQVEKEREACNRQSEEGSCLEGGSRPSGTQNQSVGKVDPGHGHEGNGGEMPMEVEEVQCPAPLSGHVVVSSEEGHVKGHTAGTSIGKDVQSRVVAEGDEVGVSGRAESGAGILDNDQSLHEGQQSLLGGAEALHADHRPPLAAEQSNAGGEGIAIAEAPVDGTSVADMEVTRGCCGAATPVGHEEGERTLAEQRTAEVRMREETSGSEGHVAEDMEEEKLPATLQGISRTEAEVVFLGTVSAVPGRLRNVSATYVDMFERGGVLVDCGEDTYGQLKRRYGSAGAEQRVCNLKAVFVTHMHADHHGGLYRLLAARAELAPGSSPILVVGPLALCNVLRAYNRVVCCPFIFLPNRCFRRDESRPMAPASEQAYKEMLAALQLKEFRPFPVAHVFESYGLILAGERGWRIVFSGDTRPCREVATAAKNADLLVHEATFEDELQRDAMAKRHSTTSEALDIGKKAGAYRIILTHFSSRYPHMPIVDPKHRRNYCIALDMMSINLADLQWLPKLSPVVELLLKMEEEGWEDVDKEMQ